MAIKFYFGASRILAPSLGRYCYHHRISTRVFRKSPQSCTCARVLTLHWRALLTEPSALASLCGCRQSKLSPKLQNHRYGGWERIIRHLFVTHGVFLLLVACVATVNDWDSFLHLWGSIGSIDSSDNVGTSFYAVQSPAQRISIRTHFESRCVLRFYARTLATTFLHLQYSDGFPFIMLMVCSFCREGNSEFELLVRGVDSLDE